MRARDREQRERWLRDPETILEDIRAAMTPQRKRTDPLPLWRVKKLRDGRARWERDQKRAAAQQSIARHKAHNIAKAMTRGPSKAQQLIAVMEPGEWYGIKAAARAAGMTRSEAGYLRMTLINRGWIERAPNVEWNSKPLDPWQIMAGAVREPKWLYRLTVQGEEAKREKGA